MRHARTEGRASAMEQVRKNSDFPFKKIADWLPFPDAQAHKYSRGRLIAVVGCEKYPGAACLATQAAARMGAGYVQVFCDENALLPVRLSSPSSVAASWKSLFDAEVFSSASSPERPCACLVGSGFDARDSFQLTLAFHVLAAASMPVLVDGGGLSALLCDEARDLLAQRKAKGNLTVLTPHAGEARLLADACGIHEEDQKRLASSLASAYHACVVLKGPDTYIDDASESFCMDLGTSALAKAGTGDVLAGMTASLLAQGLDAVAAASLATTLHALAGREAARDKTALCVCAEDLVDYLPRAIVCLQRLAEAKESL